MILLTSYRIPYLAQEIFEVAMLPISRGKEENKLDKIEAGLSA